MLVIKWIVWLILTVWMVYLWFTLYKVIEREQELWKLRTEILKLEAQIEINKTNREYCATNMQLRNDDNNKNREMIAQMKKQYNNMIFNTDVGFPQASIAE